MEVWNEEHTRILKENEIDLTKGCIYFIEEDNCYIYHIYNKEDLTVAQRSVLEQQIEEKKSYLLETDYVVIKIYEATIENQDAESLKTLYADVLARRKVLREEINELEEQIKSLS